MPEKHSVKDYKFRPYVEGLFVGLISLISLQLVTYFLYLHARSAQSGEIKDGLLRTARIVAESIDVEKHKQINDPKLQESNLYKEALLPLKRAEASDLDIEYVYTNILKDDEIYFILDAAQGEDQSLIFDKYTDASAELVKALDKQEETVSEEAYEDEWGHHMSVYVPFFDNHDKSEKMVGTLGIDISAQRYIERLAPIKIAAQRASVASFVVSFFFGLAVWFLRNFTKQMNRSRQEIAKDYEQFSLESIDKNE
ncbi:MAG: hypothetical protein ACKVKR_09065 [Pseudomonadales bacterium]|jgi:sensor histidine kinase regulating citrate/malate metabolism